MVELWRRYRRTFNLSCPPALFFDLCTLGVLTALSVVTFFIGRGALPLVVCLHLRDDTAVLSWCGFALLCVVNGNLASVFMARSIRCAFSG